MVRLDIDGGIADIPEGVAVFTTLSASGFSYGAIPVRVSLLNYSAFASRGYNLDDFFDPASIPSNSADGTYTCPSSPPFWDFCSN